MYLLLDRPTNINYNELSDHNVTGARLFNNLLESKIIRNYRVFP